MTRITGEIAIDAPADVVCDSVADQRAGAERPGLLHGRQIRLGKPV
jgi:hypothetical protein